METGTLRVRLSIFPMVLGITGLIAGLVPSGTPAAATYYVEQSGSDSNEGSESRPFSSIRHGISQLDAGDTLHIRAGTYAESIDSNVMSVPVGDSWDNPVTIAAYPGETVVLQPSNSGAAVILLGHSYVQYLIFDGLVVDAAGMGGNAKGLSLINGANHVRFINVEVKNAPHLGIEQYIGQSGATTSTYNEFIGMKVHDAGSHGIYITTSNNLIEDCDFYDNAGYGIHIYSEGGGVNNNTVRSSRVYDNGWGGGSTAGIILGSGTGNGAYDNEVWGNYIGIQISSWGAADTRVGNNIIHDNALWGIAILPGSLNAVVEGNEVYNNGVADIVDFGTSTLLSDNVSGLMTQ
jgi:parallel beta-helix repeat protein